MSEDVSGAVVRRANFARNLTTLLVARGLTRQQAAKDIGVPERWLRRIAREGIHRTDKRRAGDLRKVAYFFHLWSIEQLWEDRLMLPSMHWPSWFRYDTPGDTLEDQARKIADLLVMLFVSGPNNSPEIQEVVATIRREARRLNNTTRRTSAPPWPPRSTRS